MGLSPFKSRLGRPTATSVQLRGNGKKPPAQLAKLKGCTLFVALNSARVEKSLPVRGKWETTLQGIREAASPGQGWEHKVRWGHGME